MKESEQVKELPACPVESMLMFIGDKWKVLILRDLMTGTMRFGELKSTQRFLLGWNTVWQSQGKALFLEQKMLAFS